MGQFDALPVAGEDHAMVARHRAPAQRGKADIAGMARAGVAVAAAHRISVEVDAAAFRRRAAEHQRGAGRRIDFLVVMHLEDFDIEGIVQRLGDAPRQRRQQIDAEAHIAGLHDHRRLGGVLDLGLVGGAQAGGADDVHLAALSGESREGNRCRWRGEIDDAVGLLQERRGVARKLDAVLRQAGQHAGIPADQRRARVFQRTGQRKILVIGDRLNQRAAHPPAGAGDHKPHFGHGTSSKLAARV